MSAPNIVGMPNYWSSDRVVEVNPLSSSPHQHRSWNASAWRIAEVTAAACALILLTPLMLAIAIGIKINSPGPVLFKQKRIGQHLRSFQFYKFRTMQIGVEDTVLRNQIARELRGEDTSYGGSWKLANDSRITPIGAFLRRHSLDELPQLINVMLGQMALVGPRPCLEWEAEMFTPEFAERFVVRPGLTGLWQVSGRSTMGTREMLMLDVYYARHRSYRGDIRIIARTLPVVLRTDGAR
jgi:lipopolysaccharide/colanic/teichoic acid biosynthesis glycosyltransferase